MTRDSYEAMPYTPPDFAEERFGLTRQLFSAMQRQNSFPLWKRRKKLLRDDESLALSAEKRRNKRHLYKYLSVDTDCAQAALEKKKLLDLLVSGEMYLSNPAHFNDVNECRAQVSFTADANALEAWADENVRKYGSPPGLTHEQSVLHVLRQVAGPQGDQLVQRTYDSAIRDFGVYCLSKNPRSNLMWAHYARRHQGICVQLDPAYCVEVLSVMQSVQYSKDLPALKWPLVNKSDAILGILRKSDEWSYEAEYRYVTRHVVNASLHFDARAVRGVIVGPRFDRRVIPWLVEAFQLRERSGLPPVSVFLTRENARGYPLNIWRVPQSFLKIGGNRCSGLA